MKYLLAALLCACAAAQAQTTGTSTLPTQQNLTFPNRNAESTCVTPKVGTGASATFTPVCAVNYITIDTTGQTIMLPTNMPASGLMVSYTLDITYTGGVTPSFQTGTEWAIGTAPVVCSTTVITGCLSASSGAHDRLVGQSLDATHILYGLPITNFR